MKSIKLLLFYLLFILPNISQCQEDYIFKLISTSDGLSHRVIYNVYQDSENRIWICTGGGLNLFINGEIKNISDFVDRPTKLKNNIVHTIKEDKEGMLWISTGTEIYVYNPSLRKIELFPLKSNNDLPFERMYSISITEDDIKWIPAVDKLIKIDKNQKLTIVPVNGVGNYITQCLFYDNKMWILSDIGALIEMSLEGEIIRMYNSFYSVHENRLKNYLFDDILSLCVYKGNLIGLSNTGASIVYQKDKKQFINLTEETCPDYYSFSEEIINYVAKDEKLFNIISGNTNRYVIQNFFIDNNNLIWGTSVNGIVLSKERKNYFKKAKGIKDTSFRNIYEANDSSFYIGSYQGFYHFNPNKNLIQEVSIPQPNIFVIQKLDEDNILLASDGGWLGTYNIKNQEYKKLKIDYDRDTENFFCASKRGDGKVWLGGFNLYLLDIENLTLKEVGSEEMKIDMINDLIHYKDNLLIASNNGLYIKDEKDKMTFYPLEIEKRISNVFDIQEGKYPYFWLGTDNGLIQFNIEDGAFVKYDYLDGLVNNSVQSILPEGEKYLWLGTENGLSRFDIEFEKFTNYNETDGLSHHEFMKGSALVSSKGIYYMGSVSGLNSFNPSEVKNINNKKSPNLNIFSYFYYDNKDKKVVETLATFNTNKPVIISKNVSFLGFTFGNNNVLNSENYIYSYMLEGYDTDWIKTGDKKVQYTNIPGGEYIFKVRLANKDNTVNKIVELKFIKEEYFYKSKWMFALITFLFMNFLWALYRFRLNQINKIVEIKETIAADLHDDIGASLSSVNVLALETNKNSENLNSNLENIISLNKDAMLSIRDLSWTLNPKREKIKDLKLRMEQHLDDILRPLNIPFICKFEGLDLQRKISVHDKHHLFLIFKEAINNALKHSKSTEVAVLVLQEEKVLKMQISNKFDEKIRTKNSSSSGLKNMKKRARALEGDILFNKLRGEFQVVFKGKVITKKG